MDTGGARPGAIFLTGDVELPREGINGGFRPYGSPCRPGSCCAKAVAGVVLLLARCDPPDSCGLADDPFLRCIVELLEVGDAALEARSSTSSMECVCQPRFTLTMA